MTSPIASDIIPKSLHVNRVLCMKQTLVTTFFSLIAVLLLITPSYAAGDTTPASEADTNCQPIYGGGKTCKPSEKVIVDKKIIHPTGKMAVDNLGVNDPKFKAGQEIRFSIAVRNTGTTEVKNVELVDTMADFAIFDSGSVVFAEEDGEFFYTIPSLKAGETKVFEVISHVVAVEELPADEGIICDVNRAAIVVGDELSEDTAGFCIQKDVIITVTPGVSVPGKGGQPVVPGESPVIPPTTKGGEPVYPTPETTTVPKTGPELLSLLGLLSSAGAGLILRRKIK